MTRLWIEFRVFLKCRRMGLGSRLDEVSGSRGVHWISLQGTLGTFHRYQGFVKGRGPSEVVNSTLTRDFFTLMGLGKFTVVSGYEFLNGSSPRWTSESGLGRV